MSQSLRPTDQEIDPRHAVAYVLWSLTGLAAAILGGRAFAGAFDASVPSIIPGMATLISLLANLYAWQLHVTSEVTTTPRQRLRSGLLSLIPVTVIGFSTTGDAAPLTLGATTGLMMIGLVWLVVCEAVRVDWRHVNSVPVDEQATRTAMSADVIPEPEVIVVSEETMRTSDADVGQSNVLQRITRRLDDYGNELLEAEVRATFGVGEKETAIHLPIHPVLSGIPVVECEPLDDSDVSVTVSNAQPYGIRIEVKRTERLHVRLTVPVGVTVTASRAVADVA